MQSIPSSSGRSPACLPYLDPTYDEALALTLEARNYLAHRSATARGEASPEDRLAESCEIMRLTARLTQVVAWLMIQRAVHEGEIARHEATDPKWRLSGQSVCGEVAESNLVHLPQGLCSLLDRSLRLYNRVERLDAAYGA